MAELTPTQLPASKILKLAGGTAQEIIRETLQSKLGDQPIFPVIQRLFKSSRLTQQEETQLIGETAYNNLKRELLDSASDMAKRLLFQLVGEEHRVKLGDVDEALEQEVSCLLRYRLRLAAEPCRPEPSQLSWVFANHPALKDQARRNIQSLVEDVISRGLGKGQG